MNDLAKGKPIDYDDIDGWISMSDGNSKKHAVPIRFRWSDKKKNEIGVQIHPDHPAAATPAGQKTFVINRQQHVDVAKTIAEGEGKSAKEAQDRLEALKELEAKPPAEIAEAKAETAAENRELDKQADTKPADKPKRTEEEKAERKDAAEAKRKAEQERLEHFQKFVGTDKPSMKAVIAGIENSTVRGEFGEYQLYKDKNGWSGADEIAGKRLANKEEENWTTADKIRAWDLLNKYRRQHGYPVEETFGKRPQEPKAATDKYGRQKEAWIVKDADGKLNVTFANSYDQQGEIKGNASKMGGRAFFNGDTKRWNVPIEHAGDWLEDFVSEHNYHLRPDSRKLLNEWQEQAGSKEDWEKEAEAKRAEARAAAEKEASSKPIFKSAYDGESVGFYVSGKLASVKWKTWGDAGMLARSGDTEANQWLKYLNEKAYDPHVKEIAGEVIEGYLRGTEPLSGRKAREKAEKVAAEKRAEAEKVAAVESARSNTTVDVPKLFKGGLLSQPGVALHPYQAAGINYIMQQKRGCLFDEMGLGKSLQALAAGALMKERGEVDGTMIFVKPSLLKNWEDEIKTWAPNANVLIYHGGDREHVLEAAKKGYDYMLVASSLIPTDAEKLGPFAGKRTAKFFDEAHNLKAGTRTTPPKATETDVAKMQALIDGDIDPKDISDRAIIEALAKDKLAERVYDYDKRMTVWRLTAPNQELYDALKSGDPELIADYTEEKITGKTVKGLQDHLSKEGPFMLMTATPMPNRPEELYNLLSLIDKDDVVKRLGKPKNFREDHYQMKNQSIVGYKKIDKIAAAVRPLFLLRRRDDPTVKSVLPPLSRVEPELDLAPEQIPYYNAAVKEALDALKKHMASGEGTELVNKVVDDLHTADEESDKKPEEKQKTILVPLLRARQVAVTPELVDPAYKGSAPKLDHAVDHIWQYMSANPGKGIVIFNEFNELWPIVKRHLAQRFQKEGKSLKASDFAEIHGQIKSKDRRKAQDDFNAGKVPILLVNTKAGGEGLNLQKNSGMVVHLTDPWNPAMKDQATARVHRQGQKNPVTMVSARMGGTLDDRIASAHGLKSEIAAQVLGYADVPKENISVEPVNAAYIVSALSEYLDKDARRSIVNDDF